MAYPKQLITTLCEQLPENLTNFFNIEKRKYFQNFEDINEIVSSTMVDFIKNETSKTEISNINNVQIKMRRQKKTRWMAAYEKGISEYPITDKKNPFFSIQNAFITLSGQDFVKIYETNDLDKVIESHKQAAKDWIGNDKSLLIEFPLINSKTKRQVLDSFKLDLIISIIKIIIDSFDGNIESYFSKKPTILLDNPLFSVSKYAVPFKQVVNSYVADLVSYDKDNMVFQMLVNSDTNNANGIQKMKVFDSKDHQILLILFNSINLDFYQSKQVVVEVGAIAKHMVNSRPNKRQYEDVILRTHNMALTTFQLCKNDKPNDPVFTFSLFDSVKTIRQNNRDYLVVTFGNTLFDAVTKQKMISVTSSNYNSLDNDLSKLLYHHLQRERINLSTSVLPDENGLLYKKYDYSFFQRIILFRSKKKKENIQLIIETLKEFKEKAIALSDFSYDHQTGFFHLYFFLLSEDEKADLRSTNEPNDKDIPVITGSITSERLQ